MMATIATTMVYPAKGLHGIDTSIRGLVVDPSYGVLGDRTYAFYRKTDALPMEWRPKGQFFECMNTEGMARPHDLTEDDLDSQFRVSHDQIAQIISARNLDIPMISLVDTGGIWHLADTSKPCVSFLNLASVRDLSEYMNVYVDPRRFRMNAWVEGMRPWAELDYIQGFEQGPQYPMTTGDLTLCIDDLCERCRATHQNPLSGLWDLDILSALEALLKEQGYRGSPHRGVWKVMGWLAIPQSNGRIRVGDQVVFG